MARFDSRVEYFPLGCQFTSSLDRETSNRALVWLAVYIRASVLILSKWMQFPTTAQQRYRRIGT